jgi:hypothetical protein
MLIDIPAHMLDDEAQLVFELVLKNLYILTTNIAGIAIESGANVEILRTHHLQLMHEVSCDIIKLQSSLTGKSFDQITLEKSMIKAFEGDLGHTCMGRSAPARLNRALQLAKEFGLDLPALQKIKHSS